MVCGGGEGGGEGIFKTYGAIGDAFDGLGGREADGEDESEDGGLHCFLCVAIAMRRDEGKRGRKEYRKFDGLEGESSEIGCQTKERRKATDGV